MVIKRQVAGGQELLIELTAKELCDAYHEQEHKYDVEDVQNVFDNMEDEEFEERGLTRKEAESRIDEIAREKRRNINKYDMSWELALDEALKDFWSEYENEVK